MHRADQETYTMSEIAEATGIKKATLRHRCALLGIPSPKSRGIKGYYYEEIIAMQKTPKRPAAVNKARVAQLKKRLINDGYEVSR